MICGDVIALYISWFVIGSVWLCGPSGAFVRMIIDECIAMDPFTPQRLWRVSKDFHALITKCFKIWREYLLGWEPDWKTVMSFSKPLWGLNLPPRNRLQRDGLCSRCTAAYVAGVSMYRPPGYCWFRQNMHLRDSKRFDIHCRDCAVGHDTEWFVIPGREKKALRGTARLREAKMKKTGTYQLEDLSLSERTSCLGRRGLVWLCKHMPIYWHEIETYNLRLQREYPKDWPKRIGNFFRECRDTSHDRGLYRGECAPSWPRACLRRAETSDPMLVLHLEWAPHASFASLGVQPEMKDKRFPAPALRSLFQSYQDDAGGGFFPSHRGNALPEMTCFRQSRCSCVKYEMGEADKDDSTLFSCFASPYSTSLESPHSCYGKLPYGTGENGVEISMHTHSINGAREPTCLMTRYRRDIKIC